MLRKFDREEMAGLVGGIFSISTEDGNFTSTVTQITIVDVPRHGITPAYQSMAIYHTGFVITNLETPVDASNPIVYVSLYMQWRWNRGQFICSYGNSETFAISPK